MRRASPFPALALILQLAWPTTAAAQAPAGQTVADVALATVLRLTAQEMDGCRSAHPAHAETFIRAQAAARARSEMALEAMKPHRAEELARAVPSVMQVGQDMAAALMAADPSLRVLEVCLRTARELQQASDREVAELMGQVVTALVQGSARLEQGLERVLR